MEMMTMRIHLLPTYGLALLIALPVPALAVVGTPATVVCQAPCSSCLEAEIAGDGTERCLKCQTDPICLQKQKAQEIERQEQKASEAAQGAKDRRQRTKDNLQRMIDIIRQQDRCPTC
jgi:hypothetical protein